MASGMPALNPCHAPPAFRVIQGHELGEAAGQVLAELAVKQVLRGELPHAGLPGGAERAGFGNLVGQG